MSETIDALAQAVRERRLVVFCGAGVSMLAPSRSPSWWEIYLAAAQALADRLREAFPAIGAALDVAALLKPLTTQQLADLVASRFAGPTFSHLLAVVDVADANENHRAIAALARRGGLRAVLTTNFDTLLERAAAVRGVRMAIAAPGLPARSQPGDACVLVKLHGTTVDSTALIETSDQKAREVSPALRQAWAGAVRDADVLVLGYSGADLNFGAAQAFFDDLLAGDGRIWWLYRAGEKPQLPDRVARRAVFVEGSLPQPLRELLLALGEPDFEMPLSGRDAQAALARAMDDWSRELHIGPWAAATFYLSVCDHAGAAAHPLREALMQLAREQVARFEPGQSLAAADMAAAVFLSAAGSFALQHAALDDAAAMFRASLNAYLAVDQHPAMRDRSSDERHVNLAGGWNNLATTRVMAGDLRAALVCFRHAMRHAYLAGSVGGFLIALGNLLHYEFGHEDVRRCKRLAEAALGLADRVGAVQASIELRLLLACCAVDRNEIWSAADWLREARRRAAALGDDKYVTMADIQLGDCALRRGRIEEGLRSIAAAVTARPRAAYLFRPVDEVRRRLAMLGIEQAAPFTISLAAADVPGIVARIEGARSEARASGDLPWQGAHCSVSASAAVGDDDLRALFHLGVLEFDGNAEAATELGLRIAQQMLAFGRHVDAAWAARNLLLRPGVAAAVRAAAHAVLAQAGAALGRPGEAALHLTHAEQACAEAAIAVPAELAAVGMWFFVQNGDAASACRWAERRGGICKGQPGLIRAAYADAARLDTWGAPMAPVAVALRARLPRLRVRARPGTAPDGPRPYRRFAGATALWVEPSADAGEVLQRAQAALQTGDADAALTLLDGLATLGATLPEQQAGVAIAMQLQALATRCSADEIEATAAVHRERLLGTLSFTALARLETALLWALLLHHGAAVRAADLAARHGWVAELADDPIARASLLAWDAVRQGLAGRPMLHNERTRNALQAARYFGLPEAELARFSGATPAQAAAPGVVAEILAALTAAYAASKSAAAADAALADAVRSLRRGRHLTRGLLARIRGNRAGWALEQRRFDEAAVIYRRVQRSFRTLGGIDDALNAMAGEARAHSRAGRYAAALQLFEAAVEEAAGTTMRANLMLGLGAAHLLQACERCEPPDAGLIDKAISVFRDAVDAASLNSRERAFARLAWARALGEKGEQQAALDAFDRAVAELAHLGSANAKLLLEHRPQFVSGQWRALALA